MFSKKLLESEVSRHIRLGKKVFFSLEQIFKTLRSGSNILFIVQDNEEILSFYIDLEKILKSKPYSIKLLKIHSEKRDQTVILNELELYKPSTIVLFGDAFTIDFGKYLILEYSNSTKNRYEWIAVPTTAESDSVCSPFIFLDLDNTGEKFLGQISTPIAVVADTDIISHAPNQLLSAGIADLLSRQTSIWDWKLANRLRGESISDFVVAVSSETIDILLQQLQGIHPDHEEATPVVMKALLIAGFLAGFAADMRSCYGSEHMFAQALDAEEPGKGTHGNRVALGTVMMASLQGQEWRNIKKTLEKFNIPTTSTKIGYKTSSIIKALINAVKFPTEDSMYTILGPGLTEEAAWSLAYRTGVIGERF